MSPWVIGILVVLTLVAGLAVRDALGRAGARRRLEDLEPRAVEVDAEVGRSGIGGWLDRAGFRRPDALGQFFLAQAGCTLVALVAVVLLMNSSLIGMGREALVAVPGGSGQLLEPVLLSAPLLLFVIGVALPVLWVRRRRAERLARIEQDLPLALELLASLTQAGLGFDAALARLVASQDPDRPLISDFRLLPHDVLAGLPRSATFERLSARCAAPGVDLLVAALIHAEQLGASIASTLRTQADEAWNDRKERLLARSQSLPTRLAAPLVVCFLPGLLIVTLAPALVRFTELVSGVLDGNN